MRETPSFLKEDPVLDALYQRIGIEGMINLTNQVKEEQSALKEAKKIRLPAVVNLDYVLRKYPTSMIRKMAREWELNANRRKKRIIQDMTDIMEIFIPEMVETASPAERNAIKYIMARENLQVAEARRVLNDSLIEFDDSKGDPPIFDSFLAVYMFTGVLIAGIRNIDGRDRTVVTMASDVRRLVAKHTGWKSADPVPETETKDTSPKPIHKILTHVRADSMKRKTPRSIFRDGAIVVEPNHIIEDPFEAVAAYAIVKYRDEFDAEREHCPYNLNLGNNTLELKQAMTWFVLEWINPATGITITEEFVKETDTRKDVAKLLLQATELFFDRFKVLQHRGDGIIVYGTNTRKKYHVTVSNQSFYPVGCTFEGRIHPYMGKYKMCGITTRRR